MKDAKEVDHLRKRDKMIIGIKTRFKKGQTAKENNVNWKGGVSRKNDLIRKSKKYKEWRESVFERDDFTCQECGQIGGVLHAHHIKPFSVFVSLRFEIDNGITLGKECHLKTETFGYNVNKIYEKV